MPNYIIIAIAAVAVLLVLLIAAYAFVNRKVDQTWKVNVISQLSELSLRLQSNDPIVHKSIIIDADKLLDFVMRQKGFRGETMGDRLKFASKTFDRQSYSDIWEAHKLRNSLVHEMNSHITLNQARFNFHNLEKAIRTLMK